VISKPDELKEKVTTDGELKTALQHARADSAKAA
jgi:hypothetical protein